MAEKLHPDVSVRYKLLADDEEKYRKLFECANDAIFILNQDLVFTECNHKVLNLLEREKKDVIGFTPIDISPEFQPDGKPSNELVKLDTSAAFEGVEQRFNWVLLKKNGEPVDVEISLSSFVTEDQQYIYAFVKDMRQLKRREDELRESEARFRNIYQHSADAILIYHPENGFIDCNVAALKILGHKSKTGVLDKHPWDLSPPDQPNGKTSREMAQEMHTICFEDGHVRFEWLLQIDGMPKWFDIMLTCISIQNEEYIHVLLRDISETKRTQQDLEALVSNRTRELESTVKELSATNDELELINEQVYNQTLELENTLSKLKNAQTQLLQAEKMASLGILTAGVAHEINNPLNFIKSGITVIKKFLDENNLDDSEEAQTMIQSVLSGVDRVTTIVKGLNEFSASKEEKPGPCNLKLIIENSLNMLRHQLSDGIKVQMQYEETELSVRGISSQLHQVVFNVLLNAIQAIDHEGTIEIFLRTQKENVSLEIKDTGTGIPPAMINKVFDPFFTTKPPGEGTGLGLSIAYRIVHDHQGSLEVSSEIDEGTKVIISLPKSDE